MRRLLAMCVVLTVGLVSATSYLELTVEELFGRSDIAFYGRVMTTAVEVRESVPWTVVEFEVVRGFRGIEFDTTADLEAPPETITLAFLGGQLPSGETLTVNLMPTFETDERVLILAYDHAYASPIVGFRQGLWRQTEFGFVDEQGRTLSLSDAGEPALDGPGTDTPSLFEAIVTSLERLP